MFNQSYNWYLIYDFHSTNYQDHIQALKYLSENKHKILLRLDSFIDVEGTISFLIDTKYEVIYDKLLIDEIKDFIIERLKLTAEDAECVRNIKRLRNVFYKYCAEQSELRGEIYSLLYRRIYDPWLKEIHEIFPETFLRFKTTKDMSFRNFLFDNNSEVNDNEFIFKWYEMPSINYLENALKYLHFYNVIITDDLNDINNYLYYIQYYEDIKMVQAIHCNNESKLKGLLSEVYLNKYNLSSHEIYLNNLKNEILD